MDTMWHALQQRSRQRKQMYATDGEHLSLKMKKMRGIRSTNVCGGVGINEGASGSIARLEYRGIELRTLHAKDVPLDI